MTIYKCSQSYLQLGTIVKGTHRTSSVLEASCPGVGGAGGMSAQEPSRQLCLAQKTLRCVAA